MAKCVLEFQENKKWIISAKAVYTIPISVQTSTRTLEQLIIKYKFIFNLENCYNQHYLVGINR